MDHDVLVAEWKRIHGYLEKQVPSTDEYATTMKRFQELSELILKHDKSCGDELEREHKMEMETKKVEIERLVKELEMDISRGKERNQGRLSKNQAIWRLLEIAFSGLVMIVGILLTGKLEETNILSSKAWSLIAKPKL